MDVAAAKAVPKEDGKEEVVVDVDKVGKDKEKEKKEEKKEQKEKKEKEKKEEKEQKDKKARKVARGVESERRGDRDRDRDGERDRGDRGDGDRRRKEKESRGHDRSDSPSPSSDGSKRRSRRGTESERRRKAGHERGDADKPRSPTKGPAGQLANRPGAWSFGQKVGVKDREAVPADDLRLCLVRHRQNKRLREMCLFDVVLVVVITLLTFTDRLGGASAGLGVTQGEALQAVADDAGLRGVGDIEEAWTFFTQYAGAVYDRAPVVSAWAMSGAGNSTLEDGGGAKCEEDPGVRFQAYPIGALLLRQWRVHSDALHPPQGAVPPADIPGLPCSAFPAFTPGTASSQTFGDADPPNAPAPPPLGFAAGTPSPNPLGVVTPTKEYPGDAPQFSRYFAYGEGRDALTAGLGALKSNGWIDAGTRLVSADVLWYSTGVGRFVRTSCYTELAATGNVATECSEYPPFYIHTAFGSILSFILTLLLFASYVPHVYHAVNGVRHRITLAQDAHALPELFVLLRLCVNVGLGVTIVIMWVQGAGVNAEGAFDDLEGWGWEEAGGDGDNRAAAHKALTALTEVGVGFHTVSQWLAVASLMSWVKLAFYLTLIPAAQPLHFAAKRIVKELSLLALLAILLLGGFAMAACGLYGSMSLDYATTSAAFATNLRLVLGNYQGDYTPERLARRPLALAMHVLMVLALLTVALLAVGVVVRFVLLAHDYHRNVKDHLAQMAHDKRLEHPLKDLVQAKPAEQGARDERSHPLLSSKDRSSDRIGKKKGKKAGDDAAAPPSPFQVALHGVAVGAKGFQTWVQHELRWGLSYGETLQCLAEIEAYAAKMLDADVATLRKHPQYYRHVPVTRHRLKKLLVEADAGELTNADVDRIFHETKLCALEHHDFREQRFSNFLGAVEKRIETHLDRIDSRFGALEAGLGKQIADVNSNIKKRAAKSLEHTEAVTNKNAAEVTRQLEYMAGVEGTLSSKHDEVLTRLNDVVAIVANPEKAGKLAEMHREEAERVVKLQAELAKAKADLKRQADVIRGHSDEAEKARKAKQEQELAALDAERNQLMQELEEEEEYDEVDPYDYGRPSFAHDPHGGYGYGQYPLRDVSDTYDYDFFNEEGGS
eukprot:TRINITY_DN1140_c0_g2_i1.p1 TRINITY_DN1140_c0_g2~~TRINITY_DN1140_c0_g2_i1.p1  ORF type:complete len:1115 (+),score=387.60 TRINITY_DN1140_c0_g2_i1:138-3482(+)